jgi:hypothetical protein
VTRVVMKAESSEIPTVAKKVVTKAAMKVGS